MRYLNFASLGLFLWLFTGCIGLLGNEEDEEENLPTDDPEEIVVEKIDAATLSSTQWEWGVMATAQLSGEVSTFVCTSDTINGGYLAYFQNYSNETLLFSFDDDFKVRHFSHSGVGYVVDYSDDKVYIMSTDEGDPVYQVYDTSVAAGSGYTSFETVAASIDAFKARIDIVQPWFSEAFSMLLTTVLRDGGESLPEAANAPYVENFGLELNKAAFSNMLRYMFGNAYPRVGGFNVKSDGTKTVTVYFSEDIPSTICRRGQQAIAEGKYGDEVANTLYCGVVVGDVSKLYGGTGSYLTLGNSLFNVAPVAVSDVKAGLEFSLPADLSLGGSYLVCPYLISADDAADMASGHEVDPALLQYCLSPYPYYNIEAVIENIEMKQCTYHETSDLSAAFTVRAHINPPADVEPLIEQWGIIVRKDSASFADNMIMAGENDGYSHTFEFSQQIYRSECSIDETNFRATCDLEMLIYVNIYPYGHCLVPQPYTVVYDEKPSIRYTEASLVTALCDVDYHNVMEDAIHYAYEVSGAFWLDDDLTTYWEGPEGLHSGGTGFMGDYVIEGNFFYNHFLFARLKPTTEYLMATRKGVEFRSSNHLSFTWSGDKVSSVEIVD